MALIHSATEIYNALLEKISNEVREASGDDEALLKIIEKYNLFEEESNDDTYYYDSSNAKILIIGDLSISPDIMYTIARKEFNIPRDRIVHKDYQQAKHFDYQSLKGYSDYTDIIIGPNAHKAEGIEGYSSVVAMIKAEQNDFPLLTLAAEPSGKLKFTKTSLRNALKETKLAKLLV